MKKRLGVFLAIALLVMAIASVAFAADVADGYVAGKIEDLAGITSVAGHEIPVEVKNDLINLTTTYQKGKWNVKPNCGVQGVYEYQCPVEEGKTPHTHTLRIVALEHQWIKDGQYKWNVTKPASCTEKGNAVNVCWRCGETGEETRVLPAVGHTFNEDHYEVVVEPTCKEGDLGKGKAYLKCTVCGYVDKNREKTLENIDHVWSNWSVIKNPTCNTVGAVRRVCTVCNAEQVLDDKTPDLTWKLADGVTDEKASIKYADRNQPYYVREGGRLNVYWDDALKELQEEYNEAVPYAEAINTLDKMLDDYTLEVKEYSCWDRTVTITCPLCKKYGTTTHDDKTKDVKVSYPAIALTHKYSEVRDEDLSKDAKCTEDGWDVFLCIFDAIDDQGAHTHTEPNVTATSTGLSAAPDPHYADYKVVRVKALGHDWSEWKFLRNYTDKQGQVWREDIATCQREGCTATKNNLTLIYSPEALKENGFAEDENGKVAWFVDGEVDETANGVIEYKGDKYIVQNGYLVDQTGMVNADKWYCVANGKIQNVTSLVQLDGGWFYFKDGEFQANKSGLVEYDGAKFVLAFGEIQRSVMGLYHNEKAFGGDGKWYYCANGEVQDVSAVVGYNGSFFVVEHGVLNESYNGTVDYAGHTFEVTNGELAKYSID